MGKIHQYYLQTRPGITARSLEVITLGRYASESGNMYKLLKKNPGTLTRMYFETNIAWNEKTI